MEKFNEIDVPDFVKETQKRRKREELAKKREEKRKKELHDAYVKGVVHTSLFVIGMIIALMILSIIEMI